METMHTPTTTNPAPPPRRGRFSASRLQDLELIDALKLGDDRALDALMRKYWNSVIQLCMRVVKDEHVSEDLAQEVFLRVYLSIQKYNPDYAFYSWLSRITTNCCIDHLRYRQARPEDCSQAWEGAAESIPYGRRHKREDDPYVALADKQMQAVVAEAIDRLPGPMREVLVLRDLQGHSYKQIGEIVRCSSSAVKSRLFQARVRLRELLAPHYRTVLHV